MTVVLWLAATAFAQDVPAAPAPTEPAEPVPPAAPAAPTYFDDVRAICDAPAHVDAALAPESRTAAETAWITAHVATPQGQRLVGLLGGLAPDARARMLGDQAMIAGIAPCAFAEEAAQQAAPAASVAEAPVEAPPVAAAPVAEADAQAGSFAKGLGNFSKSISWSGYGDLILKYDDEGLTFQSTHFNPILSARLDPTIYVESEIEFEENGSGVKLEYGYVDWTPSAHASLRVGQFLIPLGEYNDKLHPSFRWNQVTHPAMFDGVIPAVWFDAGVQAFGDFESGTTKFDYSVYAVNGLETLRGGEGAYTDLDAGHDVNNDKGVGARARLTVRPGGLTAIFSTSGYTGAVAADNTQRLVIVDQTAELSERSGGVRAEGALKIHDGTVDKGGYAEAWLLVKKFTPAVRADYAENIDESGEAVPVERAVASVMYAMKPYWNFRVEGSGSLSGGLEPFVSGMSAFYF